ncbi:hypothetical protein ACFRH9_28305 [Peribacillus butanolivorans]|uniref:hypothetical protein n=1 Tax=Peribacillus butanolivorans TaxID=421767 RepID=UPI00366A9409
MSYQKFLKLDEMKKKSRGNPLKMAEYAVLKREFDEFITPFREHPSLPFMDEPDEAHINKLKEFMEESPGDESAKAVYTLQKELFDTQEKQKATPVDSRLMRSKLSDVLKSGQATETDVQQAFELAKKDGSIESRVLLAKLKQIQNGGNDE